MESIMNPKVRKTETKKWRKPTAKKVDIATVTKSGPFAYQHEDPFMNFYGPHAS